MKTLEKQKQIDELVIKGKLPIAFFNSKIFKLKNNLCKSKKKMLLPKYMQVSIPRANSNKIISKIHDIY